MSVLTGAIGITSLLLLLQPDITAFKEEKDTHYRLVTIIQIMSGLRIAALAIVCCFITLVGAQVIWVSIATSLQGGDIKENIKARVGGRRSTIIMAEKLPFINNLVQKNTISLRSYDPSSDTAESCYLCGKLFNGEETTRIA
jgi:hypothetical protein